MVFGGATLLAHDENFIKWKPTVLYWLMGGALLVGLVLFIERSWGLTVDEAFFLGGIAKKSVLATFRPHLFFDDQLAHAEPASEILPSVHVPFGVANQA